MIDAEVPTVQLTNVQNGTNVVRNVKLSTETN